jgi:beta-glucosidase
VKYGFDENQSVLTNNVRITATAQMASDAQIQTVSSDSRAYPTYGAENGKTLISLRADVSVDENGEQVETPIAYDDERWDELLDQLTWDETVILLSDGLRNTKSITSVSKPETLDHNGAMGPVESFDYNSAVATNRYYALLDDAESGVYPTQNPCDGLVSSTYNVELIELYGKSIGEACLWGGYSGLYGPGVNIHRGAYCGRAFEYYSEDSYLTGKISAAEIRGIQSKGCYVYVKHALLNEIETNREGIGTWANEQTIREVYLRPFEIAIEEGGAYNVMTSFNRLGVVWSGAQGFASNVLRGEFGMKGFAISDYWQTSYMSLANGILNGNDLPDGSAMSGTSASSSPLYAYKEGYGELAWAMRESAHRILYTVVHSNAMNGITSGTQIRTVTPWWQEVLSELRVELGIIFGASALIAFGLYFVTNKRQKETLLQQADNPKKVIGIKIRWKAGK